jgi:acyl-CoA synthetase (AMP-forming)/AMP-acid ligase II
MRLMASRGALLSDRFAPGSGEDAAELVSSGRSVADQEVLIVDPSTATPLAEGRVGEIWVRGPSVAQGYWQRPEETEQTFGGVVHPESAIAHPEGRDRFLRTGDLGFLYQGELFVTGRLKDMIIVRGQNHYPQDIEATIAVALPVLRPGCVAAFSVDQDGQERVVVAAELDGKGPDPSPAELEELGAKVREAVVKAHDLQVYRVVLLSAGTIPKTSSGKLQRHACRKGFVASTLASVAVV